MANSTQNPNPKCTVYCILGIFIFLVSAVGWLAESSGTHGFSRLTADGTPSLAFVFIAVLSGIACLAFFIRGGSGTALEMQNPKSRNYPFNKPLRK
jgi:hypothetical protein